MSGKLRIGDTGCYLQWLSDEHIQDLRAFCLEWIQNKVNKVSKNGEGSCLDKLIWSMVLLESELGVGQCKSRLTDLKDSSQKKSPEHLSDTV